MSGPHQKIARRGTIAYRRRLITNLWAMSEFTFDP